MTGDRLTLRHIAVAGLFIGLGACSTATAPPDNSAARAVNAAYFAGDFNCVKADARQIGLKQLNTATARYLDKCVRLEVFTDGNGLYLTAANLKPGGSSPIGIYWKDEQAAHRLKLGPSFVVITGRLRDCAKHNAMMAQNAAFQTAPGAAPAGTAIRGACKTAATAIFVSGAEVVPTAMD